MQVNLLEIKNLLSAEVSTTSSVSVFDDVLSFVLISGVSSLEEATESDITLYDGRHKNICGLAQTKARACLISLETLKHPELAKIGAAGLYFIAVKSVELAFAKLMNLFYAAEVDAAREATISSHAFIENSATLGLNCHVMAGAYIGRNVRIGRNARIYSNAFIGDSVVIGDDCQIYPLATILHAVLGNGCIVHSGACIGKDGFKYATDDQGNHIKVAHRGLVRIGNKVEVGANSTIDRGVLSDTIIGDMCKLDNLVQIGHNVTLGRGCIIVSQVGIAGSSKLGEYVALGGQAGVADHITIGDRAMVAAQSGIMSEVPAGAVMMGYPAQPMREFLRQTATLRKLIRDKK